jgi:hypothetical protein
MAPKTQAELELQRKYELLRKKKVSDDLPEEHLYVEEPEG